METPKYLSRVFPKGITEKMCNEHLRVYSKTLVSYVSEIQKFVPVEYHKLVPFGIYLCPLCLKSHFINTGSGVIGDAEFSLDHLPPKSAGGVFRLITCKKCNNDSGICEAELEKLLNFAVDKTKNKDGISFNIRVLDKQTGAYIQGVSKSKHGKTEIQFDEKLKKHRADYVDFLTKLHSKQIKELTLQIRLCDEKKVARALLKSAYLLCFVWWGYEFVFSENGALIRDVIAGKKDYPCQVPLNWLEKESIRPTGVSIIEDGKKRVAFLVDIRLKGIEVNTTATVLIPSPTSDGWANLSLINNLKKSNEVIAFSCTTLPRIVDRIGYSVSWGFVIPPSNEKLH